MNLKTNFKKYLCVDPSFFTKVERFDSLPPVLDDLKNSDSKIVIPTFLRPLFSSQFDLDERQDVQIAVDSNIENTLQKWDASFNKNNNDYESLRLKINDFREKYNGSFIFADDLIAGFPENRSSSFSKLSIVKKLGQKVKAVGETIYDFLVIGTKNGIIVSYGRKLISFIRKIQMSTYEGYSRVKHKMIDGGIAPKALKIVATVVSAIALNDFITVFEIMNMPPIITETDVIDGGLGIIANG